MVSFVAGAMMKTEEVKSIYKIPITRYLCRYARMISIYLRHKDPWKTIRLSFFFNITVRLK